MLSGDVEANVRKLEGEGGQDIVATGSITLVHELIRLPRRRVPAFVYPVVLGRGARLFEDADNVPRLTLLDCRPSRSGVVLTSYRAGTPELTPLIR